jgi:hypothetical protein
MERPKRFPPFGNRPLDPPPRHNGIQAEVLRAPAHPLGQPLPIPVVNEYRLPRVPPERHMVDRTLVLNPQLPRHARQRSSAGLPTSTLFLIAG